MAPQAAIMRQRAKPERRTRHYLQVSPQLVFFLHLRHSLCLSHTVTHVIYTIMLLKIRENVLFLSLQVQAPQVLEAHYFAKIGC